ncbi:MAG: right-handed parallel beta-helix repeat-containing protein, partial [Candidatus Saccharibacteria bacterium]|nr:right-handed parallel beta-helix repeat-containing protein [Candidatus Saccharibacteria bacterium]
YANGKWQGDRSAASRIVAAYDSSQSAKDSADYVVANAEDSLGSGTGAIDGAQIAINSALTAVSAAGGGTVYLMEGTYTIDANISIPNNVTLAGSGNSTLIQLGNFGATSTTIYAITNTDVVTGTGVVVRDLKLDGRRSLNSTGTQRGFYFSFMGSGLGSSYVQGATITGVNISNFKSGCLYLDDSSNSTISDNSLFNNNSGIYLNFSDNNTITGNSSQGASTDGISLNDSDNNTVSANVVVGNTERGMEISNSFDNSITGNTVTDNGQDGIALVSISDTNTVSGNTVNDNVDDGIYLSGSDDNMISANMIDSNGDDGIELNATSDNTSVTGNTITDAGNMGIRFGGADNQVTGNNIQRSTWTNIYVSGGERAVISGNQLWGDDVATDEGIYLDTTNNSTISGNRITEGGGATNFNGVYLTNSDFNSISNNVLSDSSCTTNCYAINIFDSTSDKNYLSGNRYTGSVANTASINDAGTSTIYEGQQTNSTNSTNSDVSDMLFRGSANSTTAFRVQNASATNILNVDTTNNEVEVGSSATAGRLVISDGSSNTATITFAASSADATFRLPAVSAGTYDICTTGATCSGYFSSNISDNLTNALDVQEGTNNYINVNTTDSSENLSFGNTGTNPSYNFLGSGGLTVDGSATFNGNLTLGNATSDSITFAGYVGSNILPSVDDTYDLGSSSNRWRDLYVGPTSLHVYCSAAECTSTRDWAIGVEEGATNEGNLKIAVGGAQLLAIAPTGELGIGTAKPLSQLSAGQQSYSAGTASQGTTVLTGVGTVFTSSMVGGKIVFADGTTATITAYTSGTVLGVTPSQTVSSQAFTIYYGGLQVSSTGVVGIGDVSLPANAALSIKTAAPVIALSDSDTYTAGTYSYVRAISTNNAMAFGYYNGTSATNTLTVDSTGDGTFAGDLTVTGGNLGVGVAANASYIMQLYYDSTTFARFNNDDNGDFYISGSNADLYVVDDTNASYFTRIHHNGTNGYIDTGFGDLVLRPTGNVVSNEMITATKGVSTGYAFKAVRGTNQTITSGATPTVDFDTEVYDYGSVFNTATDRFTVPANATGIWHFEGAVLWSNASATGARVMFGQRYNSGGTLIEVCGYTVNDGSTNGVGQTLSCDMDLDSGDYVILIVNHNRGSNLDITAGFGVVPTFSGHLVSRQ